MKGLAVFIVVVFACVYSLSAQSCNNPIFGHCSNGPTCGVNYLSTPQPKPASVSICSDIPAGGSSCCDATVYNTLTTDWNNAHQKIQTFVSDYQNVLNGFSSINGYFAEAQNAVNQNPNFTPSQKSAANNAFSSLKTAVDNFVNQGTRPLASCFSSVLNYYAGVVCFSCSPNWSNYVYLNATTGRYTFLIDQNTCTQLGNTCGNFFNSFKTLLQSFTTIEAQLSVALNTTLDNDDSSTPQICGPTGDCSAYVCQNLISGVSFNNPLSNNASVGGFGPQKRWSSSVKQTHANVISIINKVNSAGKNLYRVVEEEKRSAAGRQFGSESSSSSDNVDVVIKTGGYPAYTNGQQSKLSTSLQSSGSATSLKSWVSLLF